MDPNQELDRALTELPERKPDDLAAERVRRRAQAVLAEERRLIARPWLAPAAHAWSQVVTPALLAGTACAYLVWAVSFIDQLYR